MKKGDASSHNGTSVSLDQPYQSISTEMPQIGSRPDGGWGWVVVVSSFSLSLLVDGMLYSFGIFFDSFRSEFKTTKAETSWVGSVLNGSYSIVGPIVSALVNIYGCRRVAIVGAILSSTAFFCSTFTHSLGTLILTFSLLGGIGFGFMYLPAIVIVGYYFEKRRALATGIACCGSGVGVFLIAPLTEFLIGEYGWRKALLVLSGFFLLGFVFALSYRPLLGPITDGVLSDSPPTSQSDTRVVKREGKQLPCIVVMVTDTDTDKSSQTVYENTEGRPLPVFRKTNVFENPMDTCQGHEDFVKLKHSTDIYRTKSTTLPSNNKLLNEDTSFHSELLRMTRSHDKLCYTAIAAKEEKKQLKASELQYLQRNDIFFAGSLCNLKEYIEHGSMDEFRREMVSSRTDSSTAPDAQDVTIMSKPSVKYTLAKVVDVRLLTSPTFMLYAIACSLWMSGFIVPFIYMPDHAVELGIDTQKAAFLISIIGITNMVGRVAVGFLSDQSWADCLVINNVALMIGGAVTMFVPYFTHYYVLAIYSAIFGSTIAVFVSLRSIIIVELLGLEKLTTSFGFVIMFQGILSFVGSPIAGALSDYTGNYDATFYMSGITLIISGVMCLPLRRVAKWEKAKMAALASATKEEEKLTVSSSENGTRSLVDDISNNKLMTTTCDFLYSQEETIPMIGGDC